MPNKVVGVSSKMFWSPSWLRLQKRLRLSGSVVTADRLDDELGLKERQKRGRGVCRGSPRPGLGRAVESRSPTDSGTRAQRSPRFLMAALLLLTVGQSTASHPF